MGNWYKPSGLTLAARRIAAGYAEQKKESLADERSKANMHMALLRIEKIMRDYEEAYMAVHGEKITLLYRNGWVRIRGINYRHQHVPAMTQRLWAQLQERENGAD